MFAKPKDKAEREKQKGNRQHHYERSPSPVAYDHTSVLDARGSTREGENSEPLCRQPLRGLSIQDQIATDQNRVRENMKALQGSSEEKSLLQRYVGQLDSQETRLTILRKKVNDLALPENQARAELDRMIMTVSVDETF